MHLGVLLMILNLMGRKQGWKLSLLAWEMVEVICSRQDHPHGRLGTRKEGVKISHDLYKGDHTSHRSQTRQPQTRSFNSRRLDIKILER